jgi:hypothetical protein
MGEGCDVRDVVEGKKKRLRSQSPEVFIYPLSYGSILHSVHRTLE